MFNPPNMPGSTMGRSVLLYDAGSGQQQLNSNAGDETVLNMDLMQRQQQQRRLIVNEEV